MVAISHIHTNEIELIRNLWERNRLHHVAISEHFSEEYVNIRFEDRMKPLMALPENELKITVARKDDELCGYCISTARDGSGELVSLHVLESMRGHGIGKLLTESHLNWLREIGCKEISVQVAVENTPTLGFYQSIGFCPNYVTMQLKNSLTDDV